MRKYYNEKNYYVKKALKVAKKYNNEPAIEVLKMYLRQGSRYTIQFVKDTSSKFNVNLFNIENKA